MLQGVCGWLRGMVSGRRGSLEDLLILGKRSARDGGRAPPNGIQKNGEVFGGGT